MSDREKDDKELFVFPRKTLPPPRGVKPLLGVAERYARRQQAKQLFVDGFVAGDDGGIDRAMQIVAISQKALAEGKRRQISVFELERIAGSM